MSSTRLILLDEQNLFRESFATRIQASAGIELVDCTDSWEQAREQLASNEINVILVSATLSSTNPFHVCRLIHQAFPRVQVVVLDNHFIEVHVLQTRQSGALGYFTRCDYFKDIEAGLQKVSLGQEAYSPACKASVTGNRRIDDSSILPPASHLDILSARELEVMRHLASGLSVQQCADKMRLARSTVDNHKSRLMRKLNVHKSVDLTRVAIREGLISP